MLRTAVHGKGEPALDERVLLVLVLLRRLLRRPRPASSASTPSGATRLTHCPTASTIASGGLPPPGSPSGTAALGKGVDAVTQDNRQRGRLKAPLRPMRGLKRHRPARILSAGHAFTQNPRRGHYDIATEIQGSHRLRIAFANLALTI